MYIMRYLKILPFLLLTIFYSSARSRENGLNRSSDLINNADTSGLYTITDDSFKTQNIDSLVYYDSLALKKSRISVNILLEANALYKLGRIAYLSGENQKSLEFCVHALSLFNFKNNKKGMAKTLNIIGLVYGIYGNYEEALKFHLQALGLYYELRDYKGIVLTSDYLGLFYRNLNEYAKSNDYYDRALQILKKNNNEALLAETYNDIGDLYTAKNELTDALKYNQRSLKIKMSIHAGPGDMVRSYISMGVIFRELKHYSAAAEQFKIGMKIAEKTGNKNQIVLLLNNMGQLYELSGPKKLAYQYYYKSIMLAREINFSRIILDDLKNLGRFYRKTGNYKLSLSYYKKYQAANDSIFNKNLNIKLNKYFNQYEAAVKEKEIQQLKSDRQKSLLVLLILAFALIILLLAIILNRYRIKTRTNSKLLNKNKEVADLLQKLNDLNKNLSESEYMYRYLFEQNSVAMFIIDEETFRILAVNKSAAEQYGFSEKEFLGITFDNLWDKNDVNDFSNIKSFLKNHPGKITAASHRKKDGTLISVEIVGRPLIYEGKDSLYVMSSDETERKLIEQIILESEERFKKLFEGAPDAILLVDSENDNIIDANPAASRLFTRPADQLLKLTLRDIFPEHERESAKEFLTGLTPADSNKKDIRTAEFVIEQSNGTEVPVEISLNSASISGIPVIQYIFRDVTLSKIAEEALIQNEQRLKKAQKIASVGNWELNLETGTVSGSEESLSIYGFDKNVVSLPLAEIQKMVHPENSEKVKSALNNLITKNGRYDVKFKIRKKDTGETRVLESKAELICDENYRPVKVIGAIRDITELNDYQEQLIKARETAERSDRLKSDFLAQMSHEIRSPVNIILSFASLIKDELNSEANEEIKTCFTAIDNGGKRLIRTIDLILNMADIQSGKYEPVMEHTDLEKDILEKLIYEYSPAAEVKGLKLIFKNESDVRYILIDRYTVRQIFANLIDNAIKFTRTGEINVLIRKSNEHVVVLVKDSGIGISDKYIPHIFDPFSQEDRGYTRRFEGTGLGLSLVKKYCDLNGAEIGIESKKGNGTVIKILFPLDTENSLLAAYSSI